MTGENAARMIQTNTAARQVPAWQAELAQAFSRPADLLAYLGLPADTAVLDLETHRKKRGK